MGHLVATLTMCKPQASRTSNTSVSSQPIETTSTICSNTRIPSITEHNVHFTCPKGHERLATVPPFDPVHPKGIVWCSKCRHSWTVKKWTCPCNIPWVDCPRHMDVQQESTRKRRRDSKASSAKPMTDHQAQHKLLKMEGPALTQRLCLGPKLAARFAHLITEKMNPCTLPTTHPCLPTLPCL